MRRWWRRMNRLLAAEGGGGSHWSSNGRSGHGPDSSWPLVLASNGRTGRWPSHLTDGTAVAGPQRWPEEEALRPPPLKSQSRSTRSPQCRGRAAGCIPARHLCPSFSPPRSFVCEGERAPHSFGAPSRLRYFESFDSGFGAKCSRAAFAASSLIVHDVFFASAVRANSLDRSQPRKRFGSMPSSAARTFGVRTFVVSLIRLFLLSFIRLVVCYIRSIECARVLTQFVHTVWATNVCTFDNVRTFDNTFARLTTLTNSIVRSFDRCTMQRTTPPKGTRWGIAFPVGKTDLEPTLSGAQ
jgi:hypothetical protein